jgi:hypothetical protein
MAGGIRGASQKEWCADGAYRNGMGRPQFGHRGSKLQVARHRLGTKPGAPGDSDGCAPDIRSCPAHTASSKRSQRSDSRLPRKRC